jgi:hypothetical protein
VTALEPHFTVTQLADLWAVNRLTISRMFRDVPGVLLIAARRASETTTRRRRMLIPASVASLVHGQYARGFALEGKGRSRGVK